MDFLPIPWAIRGMETMDIHRTPWATPLMVTMATALIAWEIRFMGMMDFQATAWATRSTEITALALTGWATLFMETGQTECNV